MNEENDVVYVTIGWPLSNIPICNKIALYLDDETKTMIQEAKALRKRVADHPEYYGWFNGTIFVPSDLYYEVYSTKDSVVPIASSLNSPFRRMG